MRTLLKGTPSSLEKIEWSSRVDELKQVLPEIRDLLGFMSEDHHRVRNWSVRELVGGQPLPPAEISSALSLPLSRVEKILDDLESHLFFLVRNAEGEVSWAFPVTVDETPHQLAFPSGERLWAAWAIDAVAAPFVQGRLREERLQLDIATRCAHCERPMNLQIDGDLNSRVADQGADPLIFRPIVDWRRFDEPNIIHGF